MTLKPCRPRKSNCMNHDYCVVVQVMNEGRVTGRARRRSRRRGVGRSRRGVGPLSCRDTQFSTRNGAARMIRTICRLSLLLALALVATGVRAAGPNDVPLIPRAKFFGNPEKARARLSPDGK